MSKLYLGVDIAALADRLAVDLAEAARTGDFFTPAVVVVPNLYLKKWLRLFLARRFGITANIRFVALEDLFWELLRGLDPRSHDRPVERMADDAYRMMILSVLLDDRAGGRAVEPLRDFLGGDARQRDVYRKAWQLSVRLADLIGEYEFHRRAVILSWLGDQDAFPEARPEELRSERAQRELFRLITREPGGLREILSKSLSKLLKTLPQYAGEIMEIPPAQRAAAPRQIVHVFGVTQISAFHRLVLGCLGAHHDIRIHHLNPLVGRTAELPADAEAACAQLRTLADSIPATAERPAADEFLARFGMAGVEGLWLTADLLRQPTFSGERLVKAPTKQSPTVLTRLQDRLLGRAVAKRAKKDSAVTQDVSLQIVACPGAWREVETVYQSILHNLQQDRSLQQTDVAVLVTDMERYRPALQSVFTRAPRTLAFNLADFTAAGLSAFGRGVLGLIDLALESFTRSRVFGVLLNPCFLARLGVDHEQALTWLEWAQALGVYHGWDRADKKERGYPDSSLYSWQLGLRRLRLGRLMDVEPAHADGPAPRFQDVIPFADLASADKEQLDAFCRAVEGLLPRLNRLRGQRVSGETWAGELRRLLADFLTVLPDRPEDEIVRDHLLTALGSLRVLDQLPGHRGQQPGLPLALVREFIQHHLETLETTPADYLTGGVTIAGLDALRAVPFRIVYIVGLGEGLFPGSNATWAFDLRNRGKQRGDVGPADANRFLFLETLLAARDKLYLLYNGRDLQRDQDLQPCSVLIQLRRYVESEVLGGQAFATTYVPLGGNDPRYLDPASVPPYTDVLVNYNRTERLLAIEEARRAGALHLNLFQKLEVEGALEQAQRVFALPSELTPAPAAPGRKLSVALRELRGFLRCPAEASLKRHLSLYDDERPPTTDDEPFFTEPPFDRALIMDCLERFTQRAIALGVDAALTTWREQFARQHQEERLRGRVPEDAFGEVDQVRLTQLIQKRIEGADGLAEFLRARAGAECVGPVLIGAHGSPIGPRTRFPALTLELTPTETVHLTGRLGHAWRSQDALETLLFTPGKAPTANQLALPMLEAALFLVALKADGAEACTWLGARAFRIHVAGEDGINTYAYEADDLTSDEARAYLTSLVADFLDPTGLDLIPFPMIADVRKGERLRLAYMLDDDEPMLEAVRGDFQPHLEQLIADDGDGDFATYRPMQVLEIAPALVPAKACDLVRRRFRLLDRPLARARQRDGGRRGRD